MSKALNARVALKQDTLANWLTAKNWIPMLGEPLYVTDKNLLFIGDGVTTAAALVTKTDRAFYPGKAEASGGTGSVSMPVVDLNALGMPDIPMMPTVDNIVIHHQIEVDTTEILTLLEQGPVAFKATTMGIPCTTMPTITKMGLDYICAAVFGLNGINYMILCLISSSGIEFAVSLLDSPYTLTFRRADSSNEDALLSGTYWCDIDEFVKNEVVTAIKRGRPIQAIFPTGDAIIFSSFWSDLDEWYSDWVDYGYDDFIKNKCQLWISNSHDADGVYHVRVNAVPAEYWIDLNTNFNIPKLVPALRKASVIDDNVSTFAPLLAGAEHVVFIFDYHNRSYRINAVRAVSINENGTGDLYEWSAFIHLEGQNTMVLITMLPEINQITLELKDVTPLDAPKDLLPAQVLIGFQQNPDIPGTTFKTLPTAFPLREGNVYYVEWDGITYECTGIAAAPAGFPFTYVYLGNGSALGFPGNNEPFAIIYAVELGRNQALGVDLATEHVVRVYETASKPHINLEAQETLRLKASTANIALDGATEKITIRSEGGCDVSTDTLNLFGDDILIASNDSVEIVAGPGDEGRIAITPVDIDVNGENINITSTVETHLVSLDQDSRDFSDLSIAPASIDMTALAFNIYTPEVQNCTLNGNPIATTNQIPTATISDLTMRMKAVEGKVEIIENYLWSCFKAGTQILMADGTTKAIEDVKYGDMIKSYDAENKCLVDVKAYGAYCTGYERVWNIASFTNGSVLYIGSGGHCIFHPDAEKLISNKDYIIKAKAYASDGTMPLFVGRGELPQSVAEKRYELLSENGLHFANGILVGHSVMMVNSLYERGLVPLNEEEVAQIKEHVAIYDNRSLDGLTNPEYLREAGEILADRNKQKDRIEKNKKKLAALDYKQVKRAQGKLDDNEYAAYLVECDNYRMAINEEEEDIAVKDILLNSIKEKYGIKPHADYFLEIYRKQMERIRARQ